MRAGTILLSRIELSGECRRVVPALLGQSIQLDPAAQDRVEHRPAGESAHPAESRRTTPKYPPEHSTPLPLSLVVVAGININGAEEFDNPHLFASTDILLKRLSNSGLFGTLATDLEGLVEQFVVNLKIRCHIPILHTGMCGYNCPKNSAVMRYLRLSTPLLTPRPSPHSIRFPIHPFQN